MIKVKVITHFYKDDLECGGDYAKVTIELNGNQVITYGDQYHEKGIEKSEGFIDALKLIYGDQLLIEPIDVADYDY